MSQVSWQCFATDYARGFTLQTELRVPSYASAASVFCRSFPAELKMVFWFSPAAARRHAAFLSEMRATDCAPPDPTPSDGSPHGLTLLQGSWACLGGRPDA